MKKLLIFLFSLTLLTATASADVFIYNINTTFDGTSPAGPGPWLTATLTDIGTNTVKLDMNTSGLTGSEKVGAWYFNFTGNVNNLVFTRTTGFPPGSTSINVGSNSQSADGGGLYDIEFDFPTSSSSAFADNQLLSYTITSSSTLNAAMFNTLSAPHGGNGTWITSAHVQSIGSGSKSGWVGNNQGIHTPEPTTYLLLFSSLLGVAFLRRKALLSKS